MRDHQGTLQGSLAFRSRSLFGDLHFISEAEGSAISLPIIQPYRARLIVIYRDKPRVILTCDEWELNPLAHVVSIRTQVPEASSVAKCILTLEIILILTRKALLLCCNTNNSLLGHEWAFTAASSTGKPGKEFTYSWVKAWYDLYKETSGVSQLVVFNISQKLFKLHTGSWSVHLLMGCGTLSTEVGHM